MGQNSAPPRWLRGMMSFSLSTMDCRGIRESGTEWSPHVGVHFQAVLGRKQGVSRALEPAFTHRFCYADEFCSNLIALLPDECDRYQLAGRVLPRHRHSVKVHEPELGRRASVEQVLVLPNDTFQQLRTIKANTACAQVVGGFAFLAERLVFLAGLVR